MNKVGMMGIERRKSLGGRSKGVALLLDLIVRRVVVRVLLVEMVRGTVAVNTALDILETSEAKKTNIALGLEKNTSLPLRPAGVVTKDGIELVERLLLGLGDEEPDVANTQDAHDAKEDEDTVGSSSDKVGSGHADGEVVEPVGGGTDRDTLGTETEREDFGDLHELKRNQGKKKIKMKIK